MKALSLLNPWAVLTVTAIEGGRMAKMFETRSFKTNYRGPLAIHASKGTVAKSATVQTVMSPPFLNVLKLRADLALKDDPAMWCKEEWDCVMPRGVMLGICRLTECWPVEEALAHPLMTEQEKQFGDYSPGRYAWLLEDMKPFVKPVPAKGSLGLWEWEPGCTVGYLIETHCGRCAVCGQKHEGKKCDFDYD